MKTSPHHILLFLFLLVPVFGTISCKSPIDTERNGGYVHAVNKKIHDGKGDLLILKGIGLGGWMVQEGYMLGTSGPEHEIRSFLESMAGKSPTDEFYQNWLNDFVNQNDIRQIAEWGYNSVRLPMHYGLYFDEAGQWLPQSKGLELTDQLLAWCEASNIYLILDLHAAPGGQGNNRDISDRRHGQSLWEDPKFQNMTAQMWYELAKRYKDEKWIGGYDLLNEPNYDFENTGNTKGCACKQNTPLKELFEVLIDTIRTVDKNHLLIVEGNCYGSNYDGMHDLANYDPLKNLAFSFHNYWGENTPAAMQSLISLRNELNVPLWRGEIGENSNTWFTEMVELMEVYEIGYANWPWKKVNSIDGPVLVSSSPEWDKLMAYKSNNTRPRPSMSESQTALTKMSEAIKLDNTKLMEDVTYAYLRSPYGLGTKAFAMQTIPGTISLTDYDLGKYGETWYDSDYQNTTGSSSNTAWNNGESYRNDGVDIWTNSDNGSNGYYIGNIESGEFLKYSLSAVSAGTYRVIIRSRANKGREGKMTLLIDGKSLTSSPILIPKTSSWEDVAFENLIVPKGQILTIRFDQGGFDLAQIKFIKS